jgi:toxin ParE1/3/4
VSYHLTPNALSGLDAISGYLADRNPAAAVSLLKSFVRHCELLATQPYSGMAREDILPGIRHLVMGQYLAFYRIEGKEVVILRPAWAPRHLAG